MSDNVVPFKPEEIVEHLSNTAKCLTCRHEWQAVAPTGTTWLECPACTLLTGRFVGPVHKEGLYWMCKCGNDLFYVAPTGGYCGVCGIETTFD